MEMNLWTSFSDVENYGREGQGGSLPLTLVNDSYGVEKE